MHVVNLGKALQMGFWILLVRSGVKACESRKPSRQRIDQTNPQQWGGGGVRFEGAPFVLGTLPCRLSPSTVLWGSLGMGCWCHLVPPGWQISWQLLICGAIARRRGILCASHVAYRLGNDHGKSGFRPRDLAALASLAAIAVLADTGIFNDFPGACFRA